MSAATDAAPRASRWSRPSWGCGAVAAALRLLLVMHMWHTNELVRAPKADGEVYLKWAREIASGDVAGSGGLWAGIPWVLNPLYAYLLAPFAAVLSDPLLPVLLAQALLGAATAGLAAAAASRSFGRGAGWVAGLLVAFATPLAELDAHVATTELAAFLVAGACFACAPAAATDRKWAHGPVAAALWLGIGALARPVTVVALPLVAWKFARASQHRVRTFALVCAVFGACAVPSLARNWAVSGEPIVYTSAGGINAYFGNNPDARKGGGMASPLVQFDPVKMHEDGALLVEKDLGRKPTRGEVSSWFWEKTFEEIREHPGESAAHYFAKARWFFAAVEVPSSASLVADLSFSPGLGAAFVPTWIIAALAVSGAFAALAGRLLGAREQPSGTTTADAPAVTPGGAEGPCALVLAHWALLTVVFPLSHYRAPAIPAMAILAGAGVVAAVAHLRAGRRGAAAAIVLAGATAAMAGALEPRPGHRPYLDEFHLAGLDIKARRFESAERRARAALAQVEADGDNPMGEAIAWRILGQALVLEGRVPEGLAALDRGLAKHPPDINGLLMRSSARAMLGDPAGGERDAREVIRIIPDQAVGYIRLATLLSADPARRDEARAALQRALDLKARPDPALLARLGFPPR